MKTKPAAFLAAFALLAAACGNLEQPPIAAEAEGGNTVLFPADPAKGLVLVTVSGPALAESDAARLVTPDLNGASYGYMLFAGTTELEGRDFNLPINPASAAPVELEPARWTITVKAWEGDVPSNPDAEDAPAPAFQGAAFLTLAPGETARLAIGLLPSQGGGAGTFSYSISYPWFQYGDTNNTEYPANMSYGFLSIYPLGSEEPVKVLDLWGDAVDAGGSAKKTEGSVELSEGYYRIVTEFSCAGILESLEKTDYNDTTESWEYETDYHSAQLYAGKPEILAVYRGKTSAWSAAFAAGDFAPLVPTTAGIYSSHPVGVPVGKPLETGLRTYSTDNIWGPASIVDGLEGLLKLLPLNTPDTAYRIALIGDIANLGTAEDPLLDLFQVLQGRYVAYDLSGCTGTAIGDTTIAALNRRGNKDRVVSIILPPTVTTIGDLAFYDCTSLTHVVLPAGLTSIGNYSFAAGVFDDSGLKFITLPDTLTNLGEGAFSLCESLETADLPAGITAIGNYVFYSTQSLRTLILRAGSVVSLSSAYSLDNGISRNPGAVVYVPQSQLAAYRAAAETSGNLWKSINDGWRVWWDKNSDEYIFQAIPAGM
ncbi:MAG: leucine-rich repeat domain-containing protein [Treponema sp.]|jgi:hypothetical protein|nr:leucine-rich repeat domain-containing protein [Treponema sp.]